MHRRTALIALTTWTVQVQADSPLAAISRQGGVLMVRHASTEPGLGDPIGFKLGQCSTQRNLSEAGRAEALAMGAWFQRHRLQLKDIFRSS